MLASDREVIAHGVRYGFVDGARLAQSLRRNHTGCDMHNPPALAAPVYRVHPNGTRTMLHPTTLRRLRGPKVIRRALRAAKAKARDDNGAAWDALNAKLLAERAEREALTRTLVRVDVNS